MGIDISAVARVLGITTNFVDLRGARVKYLPQRLAVIGQGSTAATYSTDKVQVLSAKQAGDTFGYGSPIHLAVKELLPTVGTIPVTVYPLNDDGSGVAATGDITPTGTQTTSASYTVKINNIESRPFVISAGDSIATVTAAMTTAINAVLSMPVTAVDNTTVVDLTAKWKGTSSNDIYIEVVGSTTAGVSFGITQPTGGLVNPDVQTAVDKIGDVWESMVVNCLEISDETALDVYQTFGETRWGALTHKPLIVGTGNTIADSTAASAVAESRKDDRINFSVVAPASRDLPVTVAAAQIAQIVRVANNTPANDYGSLVCPTLTAGSDDSQWDYSERDFAVKRGSSTTEVRDGQIVLQDIVTFYHPTGEEPPAYRKVCDIVKLQSIIFNLNLRFNTPEWDGAPLIPDIQPTTNPKAKKPRMAKIVINNLIDELALEAFISDPETAKAATLAQINSQNPNRLDAKLTVQLSGNVSIIDIENNFGFYFGSNEIVG